MMKEDGQEDAASSDGSCDDAAGTTNVDRDGHCDDAGTGQEGETPNGAHFGIGKGPSRPGASEQQT